MSNIGTTDIILFECMVPSWAEADGMDLTDSKAGVSVKDLEEYNALYEDLEEKEAAE